METLTIFYDSNCGLCANFKQWLRNQESYPVLEFLPYNSDRARDLFPLIDKLDPGKEIVVFANDGRWWQGASAWLTCLWALKRFRELSFHLATPTLLPFVQKLCYLLSQNRLQLSQLLRLKSDKLQQTIAQQELHSSQGYTRAQRYEIAKFHLEAKEDSLI